jgi:alpha/beta superfamily hydrolase
VAVRRAPQSEDLSIEGPAGPLEALLETGPDGDTHAAVVCHPHPQHGGTMHNKVAYTLARAFYHGGASTLRFNYRGVGRSAGSYAEGPGEIDDGRAVLSYARRRWPERPVYLGGFSFGSMVALGVAQVETPAALVTVAPAVDRIPAAFARPASPWLVVQGSADEIVDAAAVERWVEQFDPAPDLVVLPGVGHFFDGELTRLRELLLDFLEQR